MGVPPSVIVSAAVRRIEPPYVFVTAVPEVPVAIEPVVVLVALFVPLSAPRPVPVSAVVVWLIAMSRPSTACSCTRLLTLSNVAVTPVAEEFAFTAVTSAVPVSAVLVPAADVSRLV